MGNANTNTTICCNNSAKNHFKMLREQKGWNQAELSDQFKNIGYNISQQVISKYESKAPKTSPQYTKEILSAYCTLFKTSADYLLGFTEYQGKDYKNLRDISQKIGLSPQTIKALTNYDSAYLKLIDNLIDSPIHKDLFNLLLASLYNYGLRTGTTEIIIKNTILGTDTINNAYEIAELLKKDPLKIFNLCLDSVSASAFNTKKMLLDEIKNQANERIAELEEQIVELDTQLSGKESITPADFSDNSKFETDKESEQRTEIKLVYPEPKPKQEPVEIQIVHPEPDNKPKQKVTYKLAYPEPKGMQEPLRSENQKPFFISEPNKKEGD